MTTLLLLLATVASCLAFACYFLLCDRAQLRRDAAVLRTFLARAEASLKESEDYRDAVKRSALRGAPAVKWHRDLAAGLPTGADMWYWRVMLDGEPHLFTDEQRTLARQRAAHLLAPSADCSPANTAVRSPSIPQSAIRTPQS